MLVRDVSSPHFSKGESKSQANAKLAIANIQGMENIRVRQLRKLIAESFGGSQSALSTRTGVSLAQLGQYLGGYRNMGEKTARKIERGASKPVGWLDGADMNVAPAPVGSRQIPLISCVQAGMWTEIADAYAPGDGADWLLTDLDLSAHAFALEIKGDSMLPDFRPGDRVIIDPEIAPSPGDFVVARNGSNEATFKKYRPRGVNEHGDQVFELVPLNPDYETMRSDFTPIAIIGTMVEHRRYRKK